MKKSLLIHQIIFSCFILSFSSCINQDFDFDDEKLDTNVTLGGDSINLPVGNIEKISVYKELQKLYDQLEIGNDGVLYIEYDGTFPVEFPNFEVPEIEPTKRLSSIKKLNGEIPIESIPEDGLELITDNIENLKIDPKLEDDELDFVPKEIEFSSFFIKVGLKLSGIDLNPEDNNAEVIVTLTFPENYSFESQPNTIEITVPFTDIKDEVYYPSSGNIKVNSYTLGGSEEITYTAVLKKGNANKLYAGAPTFYLIIEAAENPVISYLQGNLKGTKPFEGVVGGFGDLQDAFGNSDVLEFKNPSLALDLTTNLGTSFNLGLELSKSVESGNKTFASLDEENLLFFEKPGDGFTKIQSYLLTPENLVNFDKIINTPFPDQLDYTVKLVFEDEEAKLLPSDQLELSADYSFKIPFDFKEIDLSLKDTITNLFDEDIYEQVFSHAKKDISIEADLVDVSIGDEGIKLDISAAILDSHFNEIIDLGHVLKDNNTLLIAIKKDDLEKMKNARHLGFTFRLSGKGAIKKDDYIQIKGVRLVSGSGIHYEF
jgi:hypothetical protein